MKIARFKYKNKIYYGRIKDNSVNIITGSIFGKFKMANKAVSIRDVKLLEPVTPSKIICVGLNYKDHARELNMSVPREPIIFMKPPTSTIGHNGKIIYPKGVKRLDYEAELAVVIKKKAKNVDKKSAKKYILGYTCLNDVTARDLQQKDGQWTRAKSFDTFCPIGPHIETRINPENLAIKLYLNSSLKQSSQTASLIFKIEELLSFVSRVMTLEPSDIIATGTPFGVGPMKTGDVVEVDIEGIGRLRNIVGR